MLCNAFIFFCVIYYTCILKVILYVSKMDIRHYIRWRYVKHTIAFINIIGYITCYILCCFLVLVLTYYVLQIVYGYFSESYLLNLKWILTNLVAASVSSDLPCVDWLRGVGGNVVQWLTKDERGQKERDRFWKLIHWENLGEETDFAEVQVAQLLYEGIF